MFEELGIIEEWKAKGQYSDARDEGRCAMAHVLIEEVAEVIGCMDDEQAMRG